MACNKQLCLCACNHVAVPASYDLAPQLAISCICIPVIMAIEPGLDQSTEKRSLRHLGSCRHAVPETTYFTLKCHKCISTFCDTLSVFSMPAAQLHERTQCIWLVLDTM